MWWCWWRINKLPVYKCRSAFGFGCTDLCNSRSKIYEPSCMPVSMSCLRGTFFCLIVQKRRVWIILKRILMIISYRHNCSSVWCSSGARIFMIKQHCRTRVLAPDISTIHLAKASGTKASVWIGSKRRIFAIRKTCQIQYAKENRYNKHMSTESSSPSDRASWRA